MSGLKAFDNPCYPSISFAVISLTWIDGSAESERSEKREVGEMGKGASRLGDACYCMNTVRPCIFSWKFSPASCTTSRMPS
jgi:hypothetical protein